MKVKANKKPKPYISLRALELINAFLTEDKKLAEKSLRLLVADNLGRKIDKAQKETDLF